MLFNVVQCMVEYLPLSQLHSAMQWRILGSIWASEPVNHLSATPACTNSSCWKIQSVVGKESIFNLTAKLGRHQKHFKGLPRLLNLKVAERNQLSGSEEVFFVIYTMQRCILTGVHLHPPFPLSFCLPIVYDFKLTGIYRERWYPCRIRPKSKSNK